MNHFFQNFMDVQSSEGLKILNKKNFEINEAQVNIDSIS